MPTRPLSSTNRTSLWQTKSTFIPFNEICDRSYGYVAYNEPHAAGITIPPETPIYNHPIAKPRNAHTKAQFSNLKTQGDCFSPCTIFVPVKATSTLISAFAEERTVEEEIKAEKITAHPDGFQLPVASSSTTGPHDFEGVQDVDFVGMPLTQLGQKWGERVRRCVFRIKKKVSIRLYVQPGLREGNAKDLAVRESASGPVICHRTGVRTAK
ncbi:hypothetical protein K470DRAFT_272763 [Piedraia hortae CBS 480.64]|uniref:Uncharacterized protein n=1 Tax=Piedraia hortae CBS 480.64 TaxID=1314780 RepID=A0A6A7BS61_9PEZI|nr:hypothetical protein K470DRAFT_272763 [Piedraia hortae CBS 480.64]